MRLLNQTKNIVLAQKLIIADNFWSRTRGLLGRSSLAQDTALLIKPCNSIHTFFMRFSIDALFLDKNYKVVAMLFALKPFKFSSIFWQARYVVEFSAGSISASQAQVGDILAVQE
ncbi:MAG: DUF192 domain-containing protein [Candidatus Omnitrophica bacterium]|nr:DUF192 domain-containing protein [Candidatus Omnitrophota bacterium]